MAKPKYIAHVSEDAPQKVFAYAGHYFWRGSDVTLPKLSKDQLEWLQKHEHIELEEVKEDVGQSKVSGKTIDIALIDVFTPIKLQKELEARKAYRPGMTEEEMRGALVELVRKETGMGVSAPMTLDDQGKAQLVEQLPDMDYRDLRITAKNLGLSAKGKATTVRKRIRDHLKED